MTFRSSHLIGRYVVVTGAGGAMCISQQRWIVLLTGEFHRASKLLHMSVCPLRLHTIGCYPDTILRAVLLEFVQNTKKRYPHVCSSLCRSWNETWLVLDPKSADDGIHAPDFPSGRIATRPSLLEASVLMQLVHNVTLPPFHILPPLIFELDNYTKIHIKFQTKALWALNHWFQSFSSQAYQSPAVEILGLSFWFDCLLSSMTKSNLPVQYLRTVHTAKRLTRAWWRGHDPCTGKKNIFVVIVILCGNLLP